MSLFLWAATGGSPTGFVLFSFIAKGRSWHEVLRIMFLICFVFWVVLVVALYYLGETRHSILLLRRAKALQKSTGNENFRIPEALKQRGARDLIGTALLRPFRFLATEAIVQSAAAYNGYLYGLSFLFNGAFHIIFGPDGYGFDVVGVGLSFLGIVFGICFGLLTNIYQERYFQRQISRAGGHDVPEARIHLAKSAAIVLPVSLFMFAFTANPSVHPVIPVLATVFWGWSFYTLILMTLTYTEDAYKTFSASALAGIGFIRNVAGAAFPLAGRKMFVHIGTQKSCLVLALLAVGMAPVPYLLTRYGEELRKRSPWAAHHVSESNGDTE